MWRDKPFLQMLLWLFSVKLGDHRILTQSLALPHARSDRFEERSIFFLPRCFISRLPCGPSHLSLLSPTGSCSRQRNCRPTPSRSTTRTWTRMRSVMTIFLTNAFPIRALHAGPVARCAFKLVYRCLKAVKIHFARGKVYLALANTLRISS